MKKHVWTAFFVLLFLAGAALAAGGHGPGAQDGIRLRDVIGFFGFVTYACMAAAFATGYTMPKKRKTLFFWHKRLGWFALGLATFHGLLVLIYH